MKTSLKGRVKNNVVLSKANGLMPLFEAIVNSIQAIEDRFSNGKDIRQRGRIDVFIRRQEDQLGLELSSGRRPERPIGSFEIVDNGTGFTDENWRAFQELDFTLKGSRGCRGVGRLMWLKAFDSVKVESCFDSGETNAARWFNFTTDDEVATLPAPENAADGSIGSKVALEGFKAAFAQAVEKTADTIASRILEHLLWYYVRAGGVPKIIIHDDDADAAIDLDDVFDQHMHSESMNDDIEIKGVKFNITHVKLRAKAARKHVIAYCAAQRLVSEDSLDIPGLNNSICDDNGQFRYVGYVVSDYLNDNVHPDRTEIEIDEETSGLFSTSEVSKSDIRENLEPLIAAYLGEALENNLAAGRARLDDYVSKTAPQYLPIVRHLEVDAIPVDPNLSDAKLDRLLHSKKYEVEQELLKKGQKLLSPDLSDDYEGYNEKIGNYLLELDQIKQSDLAAYVAHRKVVLDLLGKAIQIGKDGKYAREEVLHSLIMPMGTTSEDLNNLRGSNLWLVDERLAFHQHYLGSDKSIASIPVTGAGGGKEPDLMGLNIYDNPHALSDTDDGMQPSITIVEIKRPMKSGHGTGVEKDPIAQAYDYLRRIRDGGVLDRTKRHIPNAADIPAHVYVVADLTRSMRVQCENAGLNKAPDGMRYFGFNPNDSVKAYTEVIDFQGLLTYAKERNSAFFHQLGLPS